MIFDAGQEQYQAAKNGVGPADENTTVAGEQTIHGLPLSPSIAPETPLRSPYYFSCGFALGVLKGFSELIQFLDPHAKSRACFTPFGKRLLNPAQNPLPPGP